MKAARGVPYGTLASDHEPADSIKHASAPTSVTSATATTTGITGGLSELQRGRMVTRRLSVWRSPLWQTSEVRLSVERGWPTRNRRGNSAHVSLAQSRGGFCPGDGAYDVCNLSSKVSHEEWPG